MARYGTDDPLADPDRGEKRANDVAASPADHVAGSRGRRTAVALLLVLGCLTAPLAATAVWLRNQVTDTDRYVRTVEPLADDPAIQSAVAADVTTALFTRVDVVAAAETALPPRAQFLAAPLANGLRGFTESTTLRVLEGDRFQELWVQVNRIAHQQLVKYLTDEGEVVQTADGRVVVDLTPVLAAVKAELATRGLTIFDRVPANAVSTSFVLMDSDELEVAQRGLRALDAAALVLPIVVFAALGAAIALSRRRRRTLLQASVGVAASMVVLGVALTIARSAYVDLVAGPGLPEDAATAFFDIVVHWLRIGIRAIFAVALLVAAGAFLTGPSRAAVGVRTWFQGLVGRVAGPTGVRSSDAGRWVGANRRALRVAAVLVPVVIFFLWSVPTPALLITLVVLSLLALLAIEVVGAPPASA